MRWLILLATMLPMASAATTPPSSDEIRLAKALDGFTPGKPVNCINQIRANYATEVIGPVILYKANRRLIYRNDTVGSCATATGDDILLSQNYESRLCNGLVIRTVNRNARFETGSCGLGLFTPYTKAR